MKSENARQRLNAQDEYFLDTDTTTAPTHIGALEIYHLPPGAGRDFMQKYYAQIRRLPVRAEPFNYVLSTLEDEDDSASRGALDRMRTGAYMRNDAVRNEKNAPVVIWPEMTA